MVIDILIYIYIIQKNGPSGWKFVDGSSNKLKAGTAVPDDAMRKRKIDDITESVSKSDKDKTKKNKNDNKVEVASSSKPMFLSFLHYVMVFTIVSVVLYSIRF